MEGVSASTKGGGGTCPIDTATVGLQMAKASPGFPGLLASHERVWEDRRDKASPPFTMNVIMYRED